MSAAIEAAVSPVETVAADLAPTVMGVCAAQVAVVG
jgi:hypothetical protein